MAEDEGRKTIDNIDFRANTFSRSEFAHSIKEFCTTVSDLTAIGSGFIDLRAKLIRSGHSADKIDFTFIDSLDPKLFEQLVKEKFEDSLSEVFYFMNRIGIPIIESNKGKNNNVPFRFPFLITTLTNALNLKPSVNRLLIRDKLVKELLGKCKIDISAHPNLDGIISKVFTEDILRFEL